MKAILLKYRYLFALFLFPALAVSRSDIPQNQEPGAFICGTGPQRDANALAKGRYYESRARLMERLGRRPLYQPGTSSASTDSGDIAVLEDDGSVFTDLNPFNATLIKAVRFEPQLNGAYRVVASSSAYDPTSGTQVALADDDTRPVPLGFSFKFFGKYYDTVQLNSDGNLTFGTGDADSSARDLARFLSGPPRIAPFFSDLNPEAAGSVSYRTASDGIVFTWNGVPDYDSVSRKNYFNVKLFRDSGNIEFVFGTMATSSAVVGIAPGGSLTTVNAIDYASGLPTPDLNGAIAEVFSGTSDISETALARLFFKTHPDEFDQLVVFLGFDFTIPGAFAYELNIMNEIQGIGLNQVDYTRSFGSNGRLRSFVLMGSLDGIGRFPADPTAPNFFRTYSTLEVLAHEVAHRWLAHPLFQDGSDATLALLHATDQAHWSFFFNADGSVMEGNKIVDQGVGKGDLRFVTGTATNRYSDLDRYLMGYAAKEDVPTMFLVQNPTNTSRSSDSLPSVAPSSFGGTRRDFTVDSIIGANGVRVPSVLQSPKVYRQAFILLVKQGTQATPAQIQKLQNIRNAFVPYFNQQTGSLGYSVTNLQSSPGTTPVQVYFPYFQGNSNRYTGIALANWGTTPADVEFRAFSNSGSLISSPSSIVNPRMLTIAPGAQIALLAEQIHGLSLDDPRNGWIRARSSSSQVTGFFLDGDVAQNFLDGAVAGSQAYQNFFLTQTQLGVIPGSSFSNLIDVVNPSATPASLTFVLRDDQGLVQGSAIRSISANGRLAEDLSSLFPVVNRPRTKGYVSVTSNVAVVGYEAMDTGNTVYSLPAQMASTASTLYSAQFASGQAGAAQYFTDINLINTGTQTRTVNILLVDNAGHPVGGITNPANVVLSAGQQLRARGENIFGLPDASTATSMTEGSLKFTADGPGVIGDITFGDARAQRYIASLPLDASPVSTLVFSQVAQGLGGGTKPYFTGIAIYNPNPAAVNVTIDVYSEQGAKTGSAAVALPAGGRISRTLPDLVPAITEQVRGYIRLTSAGGPVSAFELFGSQSLDFLTAVPAQPINP